MSVLQPPPAIVRLTPKAELVSEYRARFFKTSPAAAANTARAVEEMEKRGGGEGREGGWSPTTASHGTVVAGRTEAESVVVQEAALQRRVEAERIRLATKVAERGDAS